MTCPETMKSAWGLRKCTLKGEFFHCERGVAPLPEMSRCGWLLYFDLRRFAGQETVYVRFRIEGGVAEVDGTRLLIMT